MMKFITDVLKRDKKNEKGYSLTELLFVVSSMLFLTAIGLLFVPNADHENAVKTSATTTAPIAHFDWGVALSWGGTILGGLLTLTIIGYIGYRLKLSARKHREQYENEKKVRETNRREWRQISEAGNSILKEYAELMDNLENIIKYPLFFENKNPRVEKFVESLSKLRYGLKGSPSFDENVWTSTQAGQILPKVREEFSQLRQLATDLRKHAPHWEKRLYQQSEKLLAIIYDESSSETEKQLAFRKLSANVQQLRVKIPAKVLAAIPAPVKRMPELEQKRMLYV